MIAGAVLAGGQSRRFGRNKALEMYHGKRLVDHCIDTLRPFFEPLLLVANELDPYLDVQATLVTDFIPRQGPLGGIYTALLFSPHEWVFVKATDMPFLVPELLQTMLQRIGEDADIVVPMHKDRYEPLWTLYSRRCIPPIAGMLEGNERQIVAFYKKVRVKTVAEEEWRALDPEARSFWNVNTPEDWEKLQWN